MLSVNAKVSNEKVEIISSLQCSYEETYDRMMCHITPTVDLLVYHRAFGKFDVSL